MEFDNESLESFVNSLTDDQQEFLCRLMLDDIQSEIEEANKVNKLFEILSLRIAVRDASELAVNMQTTDPMKITSAYIESLSKGKQTLISDTEEFENQLRDMAGSFKEFLEELGAYHQGEDILAGGSITDAYSSLKMLGVRQIMIDSNENTTTNEGLSNDHGS